jgi:hypothetical protein
LQSNTPSPQPGLVNFDFLEMTVSVLFKVGILPELDIVSYKLEIQNALLVGIAAYGATGPIVSWKKTASL